MKKTFLVILFSIIIGFSLGIFFFKKFDFNNELLAFKMDNQVYAVQVGIYKSLENATKTKEKYNGLIETENDNYRVYIDIVRDKTCLKLVEDYLKKNNISYYLKAINISDAFSKKLTIHEELFKKTEEKNYPIIMATILKEYEQSK